MISKIIPETFKKDRKVYRSSSLIAQIDLIILALSIFFGPIFFGIGFEVGAYIMLYAGLSAIIFLVLMYFSESLIITGNFFAFSSWTVFSSLIYFTGGLTSPCLIWLLTIPSIAVFYLHKRDLKIWSALTILTVVSFFVLHMSAYSFPQECPKNWLAGIAFFNFIIILALFVSVIRSFGVSLRKVNRKLANSINDLQQSNKELERFAYIASHDLKSPLRNIVSFLNLFERRYAKTLDDTGKEYLQYVSDSAQQMHSLIEDILEYSRTTNRELKSEVIDLNELLASIKMQLKGTPKYEHAIIYFPKLPIIKGDETLLHQLFQNMIENGLKYNESIQPEVLIYHKHRGHEHSFSIEDNGIGMDPKYKDQVFEMFKRLHNKEKYEGTGIGLAICKRIIEEYKGEIEVESEIGKGTTLRFKLNLEIVPHSMHSEELHRPAESVLH